MGLEAFSNRTVVALAIGIAVLGIAAGEAAIGVLTGVVLIVMLAIGSTAGSQNGD